MTQCRLPFNRVVSIFQVIICSLNLPGGGGGNLLTYLCNIKKKKRTFQQIKL